MNFFDVFFLVALPASLFAGLAAIGYALMKYLPTARKLGWLSVVFDVYALGFFAIQIADGSPFTSDAEIFLFLSIPGALGMFALVLCWLYRGQDPLPDGKIPLTMIFYLTAVVGLMMSFCMCAGAISDWP
ncbi:hypothetical protein ACYFX5_15190 [Bremerella sp. T1]|uniref:hypothetical protein n=1 Tax=Bremerella sp. TYQ1 TaxID=3119568 RepID=UPI001CCD05D4|nr:hypothetical protein [Bremerella volcania]UBM34401.1 hypothetical protein LA756_17140 [Bremerella volcania]